MISRHLFSSSTVLCEYSLGTKISRHSFFRSWLFEKSLPRKKERCHRPKHMVLRRSKIVYGICSINSILSSSFIFPSVIRDSCRVTLSCCSGALFLVTKSGCFSFTEVYIQSSPAIHSRVQRTEINYVECSQIGELAQNSTKHWLIINFFQTDLVLQLILQNRSHSASASLVFAGMLNFHHMSLFIRKIEDLVVLLKDFQTSTRRFACCRVSSWRISLDSS